MAGTVVQTVTNKNLAHSGKEVRVFKLEWTSDASGNADAVISGVGGYVLRLVTVPGTAGDAPTTYTVKLNDSVGADVLEGLGATRSATVPESKNMGAQGFPVSIFGDATFAVSGAGSAKKGTAYIIMTECL